MTAESRAIALVARALDIQGEIASSDDMTSLPAWDSMAHVRLLLELETELGRPLKAEEATAIVSVRSVAELLASAAV